MNPFSDFITYYIERKKNRPLTKDLYWFQKHRGFKMIKSQNFGDYLSCIVVAETARRLRLESSNLSHSQQLLAIGSVLHFAKDGDVVWGSGVNGKITEERHSFSHLDVRMVRGPKTRGFLMKRGIHVPEIYGDPALLLPILFDDFKKHTKPGKIIIIPNLNELQLIKGQIPKGMFLISPFEHWRKLLYEILTSELVLTSSLHGVILAEVFGVPVRFVMPIGGETLFKYQDYYEGTGRTLEEQPSSFMNYISAKSGVAKPPPIFNPQAMIAAFPKDIFTH